jgi:hypothetical protein
MNTRTLETDYAVIHHLLIYAMLKTKYKKLPRKIITYRQRKYFNTNLCKNDLSQALYYNIDNNSIFEAFLLLIDKHAPIKTKILCGNNQI